MRAGVLAGLVLVAPLVLTPGLAPAQSEAVLEPMRKGVGLFQAGRYREAEPLINEALRRSERELGPDDPGTAAVRTTLANLYREQGRYSEAESLYQRALEPVQN
jgi:tetratricopeptide (TPR) repeat protein